MRIALELAKENRAYEGLATKFFQHYVYVGAAMKNMGGRDVPALGRAGRLLLRRAPLPRRHFREVPRALAGRPDPAVRGRAARGRSGSSPSRSSGEPALVPQEQAAHRPGRLPSARPRRPQQPRLHDRRTRTRSRGCSAACSTRRSSCPPRACAACRVTTRSTRSCSGTGRCATSRRSRTRRSRAATRTGAGRSGSRPRS